MDRGTDSPAPIPTVPCRCRRQSAGTPVRDGWAGVVSPGFQDEISAAYMRSAMSEYIHDVNCRLAYLRKEILRLEKHLSESKNKRASAPGLPRERRRFISDKLLQERIREMMARDGKEGMNARQIAEELDHDVLRVRRFINDNPKTLKRQGIGRGTKFFLAIRAERNKSATNPQYNGRNRGGYDRQ